ncbi:MAG: FHA domain-containing protein [Acidobacteriota bacterium]
MAKLRVRAGDHEFRLTVDRTAGSWQFGNEARIPLKPGDRWQIGDIILEIEAEGEQWASDATPLEVRPAEAAARSVSLGRALPSEGPAAPPVAAPGADTLAAVKPPAFYAAPPAVPPPAPEAALAAVEPPEAAREAEPAVAEVAEAEVAAPPPVAAESASPAPPQEPAAAEVTVPEGPPAAAAPEAMPPPPAPPPAEPEAVVEPRAAEVTGPEVEVVEAPIPAAALSAEAVSEAEVPVELKEAVETPRLETPPEEVGEVPEGPVSATVLEAPMPAQVEATGALAEGPAGLPPPPPPVPAPWEAMPMREQVQPERVEAPPRPMPPPIPVQAPAPEMRAVAAPSIEPPPAVYRTSQTAPLAPEDVTPLSTAARPPDVPATQMLSESMSSGMKIDRTVQVDSPPVYKLIVTFDNVTFEHILFRDMTKIGRDQGNDLVLPDTSVSRYHATISRASDFSYTIKDLNSTNGTIVNGTQVDSAVLKDGDDVDLGNYKLKVLASSPSGRFVARSAPPPPPPAVPPGVPPPPPPSMPERVAAAGAAGPRAPGAPLQGRPRPPSPPTHRPGPPQQPAGGKAGLFGRLFGKKS